jgi:hypothetical protein
LKSLKNNRFLLLKTKQLKVIYSYLTLERTCNINKNELYKNNYIISKSYGTSKQNDTLQSQEIQSHPKYIFF